MTDRRHVEMIGTLVCDEDEVGLRQSFVVSLAGRIHVDDTAPALDDERSMVEQRDIDRSGIGREILTPIRGAGDNDGSYKDDGESQRVSLYAVAYVRLAAAP